MCRYSILYLNLKMYEIVISFQNYEMHYDEIENFEIGPV